MLTSRTNTVVYTRLLLPTTTRHRSLLAFFLAILGCLLTAKALSATSVTLQGESGGGGGVPFVDMMAPGGRIAEITIRSGNFIDSIKFSYRYNNTLLGKSHGGGGGQASTFKFKKGEYITEMGGRSGKYVDSIYIRTNKGRHKKWGGSGGGSSFRFRGTKESPITGIWGRSGRLLDAIGVLTSSGSKSTQNIATQGNLSNFNPSEQGSDGQDCGKCDAAPTTYFPSPSGNSRDTNFWRAQSERLGKALGALTSSEDVYRNYLNREKAKCGTSPICQIDTRGRAITFVTGVE